MLFDTTDEHCEFGASLNSLASARRAHRPRHVGHAIELRKSSPSRTAPYVATLMHLSIICPTYPTGGGVVGDVTPEYGPRSGANVTCT